MIRMILILLAAVLVFFAGPAAVRAGDEASAYDPAQFTISYWCGPPAKFNTLQRYQEVKDAGFTVAFPPCGAMTVEQNKQMLQFCQQVGLKAMVQDSRMVLAIGGSADAKAKLEQIVKDYSDSPALLGYFITDEPGAGAFAGLGEVVAYLKKIDPKHPGFINLLPTYGRDFNALGTKTYEEYVSTFAKTVKPFVLCWDHYHFTNHGDRPDYFENLRTVRKVALETHTPFWQIVLAIQHFDYRNETEAELRYDAMQTLAFGGRGLLWFTYWSPGADPNVHWQHAMINPDGSKDPHYEMVKKVNLDTKAIGDALGGAESIAVYEPPAKETHAGMLPEDSPIRVSSNELTVGIFKGKSGKHLAMLASRDYKHEQNLRISLAKGGDFEVFDPKTKKWIAGQTTQTLLPGGGLLMRW
jgi:hypothetical protein